MPADGLMLIPPESKVTALPTSAIGFFALAAAPFGVYLSTIILGGEAEPAPTASIPPAFIWMSAFSSKILQVSDGSAFATLRASAARVGGLIILPGRFAIVRA